jgi:hypothetical protein
MGIFNRKEKVDTVEEEASYTIIVGEDQRITLNGKQENIEAFVTHLATLTAALEAMYPGGECSHKWLEGLTCYQIYYSEPKRFQLMCSECGHWIDVEQDIWQRYVAKELHREHVEQDKADREAESMQDMMGAIYGGLRYE